MAYPFANHFPMKPKRKFPPQYNKITAAAQKPERVDIVIEKKMQSQHKTLKGWHNNFSPLRQGILWLIR